MQMEDVVALFKPMQVPNNWLYIKYGKMVSNNCELNYVSILFTN